MHECFVCGEDVEDPEYRTIVGGDGIVFVDVPLCEECADQYDEEVQDEGVLGEE